MFIAFDGEGCNVNNSHNYFLLASSDNKKIIDKNRSQLSLDEILKFLTRPELLNSINIWYSFNYDICMIFKTLPQNLQYKLFHGEDIIYNNIKIHYFPKKILTLINQSHKNFRFHFYDIYGFFQSSFEHACEKWNIEIPKIIKIGKSERQIFDTWNLFDIIEYNNQEIIMLVKLAEKLNDMLLKNNINLSSFHGAGTIANYLLEQWIPLNQDRNKRYPIKTILYPNDNLPEIVRRSSRCAYFGGRIELFKRYDYNDIYHYDINSAYPTAMQYLPDLSKGKWYFIENPSYNDLLDSNGFPKFGICRINWKTNSQVGAFPFRTKNSCILFPNYSINKEQKINARGQYHTIEVITAIKKGYKINIDSAFLLEEPYTYPLRKHIQEIAQKRLTLKNLPNGQLLSMPLKLGMNSLYGKIAQKPTLKCGQEHQHSMKCFSYCIWRELLFAGFITAYARSQLLKYLKPASVILTATDSIYSLEDLDCPIGQNLGEWEFKKHQTGKFLLAGIYLLDEKEMKTRGFPKISIEQFNQIFNYEKNRSDDSKPAIIKDRTFIGIRKGLTLTDKSLMCSFQEIDRIIDSHNNEKRIFITNDYSLPNNLTQANFSYPYNDGTIKINNMTNKLFDEFTEEFIDEEEYEYESFDN